MKKTIIFLLLSALSCPLIGSGARRENHIFENASGVQKSAFEKPRLGGTLRVKPFAQSFKPSLDPALDPNYFIFEQLYDGLVRTDNNFNIIPSLAEYWVISDEGKKLTFYLRKGVKFHSGRELSAEDVKFSLERLIRNNTDVLNYFTAKVVGAEEFRGGKASEVTGFKVADRYRFEIDWKYPYVSGLYFLSTYFCKILPRDLVLSQGNSFFMKPSGTGAFKFSHWLRTPKLDIVGVRLERNEDYFGELPYLEALEFSPYFTVDQFKDNDVHIIPLVSESLASGRYQVLENNSLDLFFLGLSCRVPPLDRRDVRQALALAMDKTLIARAAHSIESPPQVIDTYVPADLPGFFPLEGRRGANRELARRKLSEAGFGANRSFPDLSLCFLLPRTERDAKLYREIRNQLEELGIKLDQKYFKSLEEMEAFPKPHLMLIERRMAYPDPENLVLPMFQSFAVRNSKTMKYSSLALDKLLAASEVEASWEKRIKLFHLMEQILFEDVPAVPLCWLLCGLHR